MEFCYNAFMFMFLAGIAILGFLLWQGPFTFSRATANDEIFETNRHLLNTGAPLPFLLKPHVRSGQWALLKLLVTSLDQAGIDYWITDTTLLGAVKYNRLMPWEDRVNICIKHNDRRRLIDLRPSLEQNGSYVLFSKRSGGSCVFATNNATRFPAIDIDWVEEKDGEWPICTPLNELGEPTYEDAVARRRDIFPTTDLFPLGEAKLYSSENSSDSIMVKTPNSPTRCLQIQFGANWRNYNVDFPERMILLNNRFSRGIATRLRYY